MITTGRAASAARDNNERINDEVRRYEGLIILNTAGQADGALKAIESAKKSIIKLGGKIEAEQKLDRRAFARVTDKKVSAGFYVNLIFSLPPAALAELKVDLKHREDVFRMLITLATAAKEPAPAQ